jgi:hypothetical protein
MENSTMGSGRMDAGTGEEDRWTCMGLSSKDIGRTTRRKERGGGWAATARYMRESGMQDVWRGRACSSGLMALPTQENGCPASSMVMDMRSGLTGASMREIS